jgi:HEAT repeat protein
VAFAVVLAHAALVSVALAGEPGDEDVMKALETQLAEANWAAVETSRRAGPGSVATLRAFAADPNFRVRQIVVSAAAALGVPDVADLLASGLKDPNVNVRLAAAKALRERPYPGATNTVLEKLESPNTEPVVRELLALAAGHLPGERTVKVLKSIDGEGELAANARMALAKLGEPTAKASLVAELGAREPLKRYNALAALPYVGDAGLAPHARKLLSDYAEALNVGLPASPRYRRVCDQALDSLVALRALRPPFPVTPTSIYTDDQLDVVRGMTR